MRIGIDARYLNGHYSGIAKYSENLILALAALDSKNEYIVYVHPKYHKNLSLGENFRIEKYPARPVSLATLWQFGKFISQHNLDILHAHFPLAPLTYDGPLLVTVHDLQALMVPEFAGKRKWILKKGYELFYNWVYPTTIKRAEYLISVSRSTRNDIARYFPTKADNTIVILSGLEEEFHQPLDADKVYEVAQNYDLPSHFVLYIGSTRPNKNLPNMIRAFALLAEQASQENVSELNDLHLVMVVQPDRFFTECRHLVRHLGIQERVKIFHSISETEKRAFYRLSRALYFVTKNEGFGFPLLEAQACGTPVLAAQHSSLPEIANDTALMVNTDAIEEIADGLKKILLNETLRERLMELGRENAAQFKWSRTARLVLEVYHHLYSL